MPRQLSAGDVLETILEVTNPASAKEDFKFQALFHTYFRLPDGIDPTQVVISDALKGRTFKDKTKNYQEGVHQDKDFNFVGEVDKQWYDAPSSFAAQYGKSHQGIKIETSNLGASFAIHQRA